MLAVIADDITGAAEIAGIGLRFGLKVNMVTELETLSDCDLLVYATDTRSMSMVGAVETSKSVIKKLIKCGCTQFYKKTDSALRGYIVPELKALMKELNYTQTLLIPQNPSRGRIIENGIYVIDGIPLHTTSFTYDPEFPARTSDVKEYLHDVEIINFPESNLKDGIFIANAVNKNDIKNYISTTQEENILFAGGADFFMEYLFSRGNTIKQQVDFEGLRDKNSIVICGSTMNHSLQEFDYFKRKNVHFCNMPKDVFEGNDCSEWLEQVKETYLKDKSIVVSINQPPKEGKEYAVRLRCIMAKITKYLIDSQTPQELIIEGGATAFAILNELGWFNFRLTNEIVPGVVRMSLSGNSDVHITLKPGSYDWGDKIFS